MVNIDERLQEFHVTHSDSYNICTSDEENVILYSYSIFSRKVFSRIQFPLRVYYVKLLLCKINVIFLLFKYLYDFKFPNRVSYEY